MAQHAFEVHAHSAAPPSAVYALLVDIPGWANWGAPLIGKAVIDRPGVSDPCGVGAIRKVGRPPFMAREEITALEPDRHMSYVIRSPGPTRSYSADVDLEPAADGGTDIRWRAELEPTVPGTGGLVRWFYGRAIRMIAAKAAAAAAAAAHAPARDVEDPEERHSGG